MKSAPVYSETRPVRLWARFDSPSVAKLDLYAEHKGITRAALMHVIIAQWLDARPDKPDGPPVATERSYDQSRYMRERLDARERAAAVERATGAMNAARENLQEHFHEIAAALDGAARAIEAAGEGVGIDPSQLDLKA